MILIPSFLYLSIKEEERYFLSQSSQLSPKITSGKPLVSNTYLWTNSLSQRTGGFLAIQINICAQIPSMGAEWWLANSSQCVCRRAVLRKKQSIGVAWPLNVWVLSAFLFCSLSVAFTAHAPVLLKKSTDCTLSWWKAIAIAMKIDACVIIPLSFNSLWIYHLSLITVSPPALHSWYIFLFVCFLWKIHSLERSACPFYKIVCLWALWGLPTRQFPFALYLPEIPEYSGFPLSLFLTFQKYMLFFSFLILILSS